MIIKRENLHKLREDNKNKKIIFAGGVFDLLHITHIRTFKNLRKYGDIVVIGIVSDKRVKERKGPSRPILTQSERIEIADAIKYVDYVVQLSDPDKKSPVPTMEILKKLKPDVFVSVDEKWKEYETLINDLGIELEIVKRIHPDSTTSIIKRVHDSKVD